MSPFPALNYIQHTTTAIIDGQEQAAVLPLVNASIQATGETVRQDIGLALYQLGVLNHATGPDIRQHLNSDWIAHQRETVLATLERVTTALSE